MLHLDVHLDMFRETADVELCLLTRAEVALMAEDGVVTLRIILDSGGEGQLSQLRQTSTLRGRTETQLAQRAEALLGGHAFILLKRVIPCLGSATKMVRCQPCAS